MLQVAPETPRSPLRRAQIGPILVLIVLVMAGNGMVVPMMSLYAQQFNVSGTLVGMMITLFGVGRLVANIPAGIASERFGRRPFLCLGPAIIAVGAFGAALAETFEPLLFWRFVQGVGSGVYMTVSATVLVQISRVGERGRIMALYQGGLLFGAGIGPGIGGLLVAWMGFAAPFWAFGVVALAALVVALVAFEEPAAEPAGSAPEATGNRVAAPAPSLRGLLTEPTFLYLSLINFGVFFTRTASQWVTIPLIAADTFAMPVAVIGGALTLIAASNFVMLPMVGAVIDRVGSRPVTIWSTVATAVSLVMIAFAGHVWVFWAAMVLMGIAGAFSGPSVAAALADRMPRGLQGPAMGVQRVVGDAGFVVAPLFVGLVYDATTLGNEGAVWINAILMGAAAALFAFGARPEPAPKA
ncbi:MFS transporter [Salinarimonas chemoclinalis]|uniref:MFS transporter n=1 Tax=Salinarimonas chemoclinalis TaxID=3241599 RepID=UPI0035585CDD